MTVTKKKDCVIYKAGKNRKLKFKNVNELHSVIILKKESNNIVEVKA